MVVAQDLRSLHPGQGVFDAAVDDGVVVVVRLRIAESDDQASVGVDGDRQVGGLPVVLRPPQSAAGAGAASPRRPGHHRRRHADPDPRRTAARSDGGQVGSSVAAHRRPRPLGAARSAIPDGLTRAPTGSPTTYCRIRSCAKCGCGCTPWRRTWPSTTTASVWRAARGHSVDGQAASPSDHMEGVVMTGAYGRARMSAPHCTTCPTVWCGRGRGAVAVHQDLKVRPEAYYALRVVTYIRRALMPSSGYRVGRRHARTAFAALAGAVRPPRSPE